MLDKKHPRLDREMKTVQAMIQIYCHDQHATRQGLCPGCQELADYARTRLEHCPFGENKSTCANCAVHCYKPAMKDQIRAVMRYAGPRMLYRRPLLAIQHLLDGRKKAPELTRSKR